MNMIATTSLIGILVWSILILHLALRRRWIGDEKKAAANAPDDPGLPPADRACGGYLGSSGDGRLEMMRMTIDSVVESSLMVRSDTGEPRRRMGCTAARTQRDFCRERSTLTILGAAIVGVLLAGCSGEPPDVAVVDGPGSMSIKGEVWADNWFAFHLGDRLIIEDSTPITTERSFNAEVFVFNADYPLQLNFVAKDFREDDTGLEYIGRGNQQMGDGGLIAQFTDAAAGATVAVTNADWKCLVVHEAPLDRACEAEADPEPGVGPCGFTATAEPDGWRMPGFDDAEWPSAVEHSVAAVRPKGGYDDVSWRDGARLIWSADLETHNTLLCRLTVE